MSAAEDLYKLLTDDESVEILAREQFYGMEASSVVPDKIGRRIVRWVVREFQRTGGRRAPSREAIEEVWADELEESGIDLGDDTEVDDINLIIDTLRRNYITNNTQKLSVKSVETIRDTEPTLEGKLEALDEVVNKIWYQLWLKVSSRRQQQSVGEGIEAAARSYIDRKNGKDHVTGLQLGLPEIDSFLHDIRPGEILTVAAETGVGKSWVAAKCAWHEYTRGRRVVLFTLENDVDTTYGRIAVVAEGLNYTRFQSGTLTDDEAERFQKTRDSVKGATNLLVVQPNDGERDADSMMRFAQTRRAQSVIIDQLTFMEAPDPSARQHEQIEQKMRRLAIMASEDRNKTSVLLLHQINREGGEHVTKTGVYLARHMAHGSEVERTSHFLIAIYQSDMLKAIEDAEFQLIKSRRTPYPVRWLLSFRVGWGDMRVQRRIDEQEDEVSAHSVSPAAAKGLTRGPAAAADDDEDEDDGELVDA